jgi:hypothetical protein
VRLALLLKLAVVSVTALCAAIGYVRVVAANCSLAIGWISWSN